MYWANIFHHIILTFSHIIYLCFMTWRFICFYCFPNIVKMHIIYYPISHLLYFRHEPPWSSAFITLPVAKTIMILPLLKKLKSDRKAILSQMIVQISQKRKIKQNLEALLCLQWETNHKSEGSWQSLFQFNLLVVLKLNVKLY